MSITLKTASATTIVLTKAKTLANGILWHLIGASYALTTRYRMTQNIGQTGTAKNRCVVSLPYSYVDVDGLTKYDVGYFTIESTLPATMPQTEVTKLWWLGQSSVADATMQDLMVSRAITGS